MKTIVQQWRPRTPLTLDYVQNHTIRTYTGMRFCVPPNTWAGTGNETIDASKDLIIICRLPGIPTTLSQFADVESVGVLYRFYPIEDIMRWSPILPTGLDEYPLASAREFLRRFPRLRVLYIIVKPQDINDIDPQEFAEYMRMTNRTMTNYHYDYTETVNQIPPKTFNARQRIYYEVPEVTCRGLESTYSVVSGASIVTRLGTDLPPLVIRVMTWKQAPGVRGRFDRN
ncbi:hypothetical protein H9Q69_005783 [Fusarium xylarioides]|uniref:Uncharacterized protein n=1 Tax=Fusarium xylarioides TaxID=221167 RepID=A0A9P7HD66_9HYPO|nr:hypothetical protein H9Q70_002754 [Fusarium xylarioides]KAG5758124.1 hypothetical protein H9Q72_013743 [Fusarium xylarioides]KAG5784026.1 hypothetical protein H9Q73_002301 [Fusarium xylarioides]KAG5795156.1 hypothetical protein H9Q69_005783 [Fusarium xylarioides]KAG5811969.1 hypothetical protein H9Q71_004585 [Fusarium xylarioides]